ncbi:ABC transporter permease [Microbacterium testaceum]|uniref:ABC transporter permease n=2 Tax=Microbacterium testaceum TaxID=2033 RepID=A0A147F7J5_MICTE|nr:ABC transporter permease [Microbacterium testaceum]
MSAPTTSLTATAAASEPLVDAPATRSSALSRRLRTILGPLHPFVWLPLLVTLAVLGVVWERVAEAMPYLLPPLAEVGETLVDDAGYYVANAAITLGEALAGLGIGFAAAFVVAVLVSELPVVRRAILPLAVVLNVTPIVAIAPALVVAFGFGPLPKIVIAALICFFPILINTATGLRSVPSPVMQVYRTINASRVEILVHLRVPSALPYVFAALRIVFPLSIIGAVVAELSASGAMGGLGTVISVASSMNQLAVVYASILVLAILGILLLGIVVLIERRALRWHAASTT